MAPLPSLMPPDQMADPFVFMLPLLCVGWKNRGRCGRVRGSADAVWHANLRPFEQTAPRAWLAQDRSSSMLPGRHDVCGSAVYFRFAIAKSFKIAGYKKFPGNARKF